MCRVFIANKEGIQNIEEKYGLADMLQYLEDAFGGHGNGLGIVKNGKVNTLIKGLTLSCEKIAREVLEKQDYDYVFFHTRLASVGNKSNKNCHPFIRRKRLNDKLLQMNGTIGAVSEIANILNTTDTEAILRISDSLKIPLKKLCASYGATFMGMEEGHIFVTAKSISNDLQWIENEQGEPIVFASEFPCELYEKITIYEPKKYPFINVDFAKIESNDKDKAICYKTTGYGGYNYGSYGGYGYSNYDAYNYMEDDTNLEDYLAKNYIYNPISQTYIPKESATEDLKKSIKEYCIKNQIDYDIE